MTDERMPRKRAAEELIARLGLPVTEAMLAQWATQRRGPRFAVVLGKAIYSRAALDEWTAAQLSEETPASKPRRRAI